MAVATSLEQLCLNTIRGLAMDAVQRANSGHPGLPMGATAIAHALWTRHLRFNPRDPNWPDRDRFILSAGHGSMLLYALLYLTGYDVSLDDLKAFRQFGSKTPGHPENHLTPGVEMATGPLGQGIATSVGMALAERYLRARGEIEGHYTYALCSDGDLMEGVSQEAASLAGHQKLGRLIWLYDDNRITIDGATDLTFSDDTEGRFRSIGWHVERVDGMDVEAVDRAIGRAKEFEDRPSLLICRTIIGYGSPNKAGTSKVHGAALGPDEVRASKRELGVPEDLDFYVPEDVLEFYRRAIERGAGRQAESVTQLTGVKLGPDSLASIPPFDKDQATRKASHTVLNAIAKFLPNLVGGSADLAESVFTDLHDAGTMQADNPTGRNIAFGVREHAMMAAVNGLNLHGGMRAYGGTFLIFSDYCRPSLRLAALMECPSIFIFSHDSIGLGEDGPTHQPIEHLMALRAIPNFNLMRPCDGNETAACWKVALDSEKTPCAIILTRQAVPAVSPSEIASHPAHRGAYVLRDWESEGKVILVATGSEVGLACEARDALQAQGIATRVVSMPSWFLFERQDVEYRASVFPPGAAVVSIEAGATLGWDRYAQAHVGIDHFGASAPASVLFREFGFTVEAVVAQARSLTS